MKKLVITSVISILISLLAVGIIIEISLQRKELKSFDAIEKIDSDILKESRKLLIHLPHEYKSNPAKKYPVVFALDGASHGGIIANAASILNLATVLPEMIIVSIPNNDRNKDLTPSYILQGEEPEKFGEGKQFLSFLEKEVIPHINQHYRTNGHRILSGHSRAGLFTLYSFLEKPDLFESYFCISPAFWRDDHLIVNKAQSFLEQSDSLGHFIYLSLGENENQKMKNGYDAMNRLLDNHKIRGLESIHQYTPGANHHTNPYYSIPSALQLWGKYYKE